MVKNKKLPANLQADVNALNRMGLHIDEAALEHLLPAREGPDKAEVRLSDRSKRDD